MIKIDLNNVCNNVNVDDDVDDDDDVNEDDALADVVATDDDGHRRRRGSVDGEVELSPRRQLVDIRLPKCRQLRRRQIVAKRHPGNCRPWLRQSSKKPYCTPSFDGAIISIFITKAPCRSFNIIAFIKGPLYCHLAQ